MKFAVCSDLHLEFGTISLKNTDNADVLVLSGDICIAGELRERDSLNLRGENDKSNHYHNFFEECCSNFPHVVYVLGNHEHYHGDFSKSLGNLRTHLGYLANLHILEKEFVEINGVCIAGASLWTDMNKEDPVTIQRIKGYMNDYKIIDDSSEMVNYKTFVNKDKPVGMSDDEWMALDYMDRVVAKFSTRPAKFSPEKSVVEHKATLEAFKGFIESRPTATWVVVGHHAPCKLSTKPQYERDVIVNGAYSSDLSEFILDHPQIKLWTHGHTHHEFDYMVGGTRIFANPRGYHMYEHQADIFTLKTVEV
jgi:DNA repair exonuclease SbcCD nuclease subunit